MIYVLGIVGSPRKKNTCRLIKEALRATKRESNTHVELVHLSDMNINHCQGCGFCKKTANCKINDDMQQLYQKLTEADALILGTPTFFWDVSGLLKDFIDRTHPLYIGEKLKGKFAAAIVTAAATGQGKALSTVESFFQLHNMINLGNVTVALREKNLHEKDFLKKSDLRMARLLGKKVIDALVQQTKNDDCKL